MNLWIRSQDRENLCKANGLRLESYNDGTFYIMACGRIAFTAGIYKSKERALEVLDEIQSCIQTNCLFDLYSKMGRFYNDFNKKWNCVPVYQIPKE